MSAEEEYSHFLLASNTFVDDFQVLDQPSAVVQLSGQICNGQLSRCLKEWIDSGTGNRKDSKSVIHRAPASLKETADGPNSPPSELLVRNEMVNSTKVSIKSVSEGS
eukprot:c18242_g1_i5.p1 GENE.c18242_g1_i5~~c18242_g1_i5.p1  ORF type:complete len:107 (+),score=8.49 c18242_g1_i5:111-431(+)